MAVRASHAPQRSRTTPYLKWLSRVGAATCVAVGASFAPVSKAVATAPFVRRPLPSVLPSYIVDPIPSIQSPPCRPSDLVTDARKGGGEGGHSRQILRFTNTSEQPCSLTGRPKLTATLGGDAVAEARSGRAFYFDPYPPRDLGRGDLAILAVETSRNCDAAQGSGSPVKPADGVVFHLEGGDLAVPLALNVICGLAVTTFGSTQPPMSRAPDVVRLKVGLSLPTSVRGGESMTFVVSLSNPSSSPVSLAPCPGYRLEFTGPGIVKFVDTWLALNCDTIRTIDPGRSVDYQIRATVPPEISGRARVSWGLVPLGEGASGPVWVYRSSPPADRAPVFRWPSPHPPPDVVGEDGLLPNGLFPYEARALAVLSPTDPSAAAIRKNTLDNGRFRRIAMSGPSEPGTIPLSACPSPVCV